MKGKLLVGFISISLLGNMLFSFPVSAGENLKAAANPFQAQDSAWSQKVQSSTARSGSASAAPDEPKGGTRGETQKPSRSGSYNVKFISSASFGAIDDCVKNYHYKLLGNSGSRLFNISTDDIQKFKDTYKNIIGTVEPDRAMKVCSVPDDTLYSSQWAIPDINLPQAWDMGTGSANVKVAVIDTGFSRTLTDFSVSSVLPGYDVTGGHAGVTADTVGHGTMVSSIIGAATDNHYGMAGACWNVTIVPYKVDSSDGYLYDSDIIQAVEMAADAGCSVINMSFGGYTYDSGLNDAIQYARGKGCILVAAAGNEGDAGDPEAGQYSYPASYDGVVSVASVDSSNTVSAFSQYNSKIDVAAPGEDITVDDPDYIGQTGTDAFVSGSGTSFASPYVAAVAALARSRNPGLTADDFQNLIMDTSTDLGTAGRDNYYGWGLINARSLVFNAPTIGNPSSPFVIDPGTGLITGYTGVSSNVVIPSQIDGVTVTGIGANAFKGSSVSTVSFPDTIRSIGNDAFFGCASLISITLPDSVTGIGSEAFEGCINLTSIYIPSSVQTIGTNAFLSCTKLTCYGVPGSYAQTYADSNGIPFQTTGLTGIVMKANPAKVTYVQGQNLDVTGAVITEHFNDGTSVDIPVTLNMVSGYNANTLGPQMITVAYGGKTTTFNVSVIAKAVTGITVKSTPTTTYVEGKSLNLTGAVITASYNDGTAQNVNVTQSMVSGYNANSVGGQTVTITYGGKTASFRVTVLPEASVEYQGHVQNIGWQNPVSDGALCGTTGQGLRVEALKIGLADAPAGLHIEYRAHVQNIGWQNWIGDNALAGTTGKGLRIEAVQIRLTGTDAQYYSVEYQAHVQNIGWQGWEKDGETAGTTGQGLRIEAIMIKIVPKIPGVTYQSHVENIGWQTPVSEDGLSGTTGRGLQVEALRINLVNAPAGLTISYRAHVENIGWQSWVSNGAMAGTTGRGLRIEAFQIELQGTDADEYRVVYQAHVQNVGWQSWVSDGATAGTTGRGLRVEALRVMIVKK